MCADHGCEYREENAQLQARIAELESELAQYKNPPKDSGNSSVPPSKEQNRNRYPKREKSGKKPGGQPGHPGHTHPFSQTPDKIVVCPAPQECQHCHSKDLSILAGGQKRQVVDIPEPQIEVTQYEETRVSCNKCGKTSRSQFPEGVNAYVQIGERAQSLAVLFKTNHAVSNDRVVELLEDLYGLQICEGWVEETLSKRYKYFLPIYSAILFSIVACCVVGSDETGIHMNGKKLWTWIFQTVTLVYYQTSNSRGFKVIEETIGKCFAGTWVSDRLPAQLKLLAAFNQWCLAHIIRECRYLIQTEGSPWAMEINQVLTQAIHFRNEQGEQYNPKSYQQTIYAFEGQLNNCFGLDPPKSHKGQTLFKKLRFSQDKLLRFLHDPSVPPTNNDSERPLRQTKLLQKVFGGYRTFSGAQRYDVFLSIIQTAKRQQLNVLDVLCGKTTLCFSLP